MKKLIFTILVLAGLLNAQTYVQEITTSTTWTAANSPYILPGGNTTDEIAIYIHNDNQPVTLTIEAGVTIIGMVYDVSFGGGTVNTEPQSILVGKNGAIKALGTSSNPVKFTSDESTIGKSQWGGIYFEDDANDAGSEFNYTIFEGAGYEFDGAVVIESGSPKFNYCTFENNNRGITGYEFAAPIVLNSFFNNNNDGIDLDGGGAVITGNTFTDNGTAIDLWFNFPSVLENNLLADDQEIILPEIINSNTVVNVPGFYISGGVVPYLLRYPGSVNDISVTVKTSKLEINKGVIIRGGTSIPLWPNEEPAYILLDTGGSLLVKGAPNEPVIFTSTDDDKGRGQWGGIVFSETANNSGSVIDNAIIECGGFEFDGTLILESGSVSITNSQFRLSHKSIYVQEGATPIIENCWFYDNYYNGIEFEGGGGIVKGNRFENTERGVAIELWKNFPTIIENNILVEEIRIQLPDTIDQNYELKIPGYDTKGNIAPYYIRQPERINDCSVNILDCNLTIQSGVEIRASHRYMDGNDEPAFMIVAYGGSITSMGTEQLPVRFRGTDTPIHRGNWGGIIFESTADNDNTQLINTIFESGGFEFDATVEFNSGSPRIENCVFNYNNNGLLADSGSTPQILNSKFLNSQNAGIHISNGAVPVISGLFADTNRWAIDCDHSSFILEKAFITGSSYDGIRIDNSTGIEITNSEFKNNSGAGITIPSESKVELTVSNSVFIGNYAALEAYMQSGSDIKINYCDISGNESYGIRNRDEIVIDAKNNWWGDPSGPYDNSNDSNDPTGLYNPEGLGDEVTDYVDYGGWLTFLETESPNILCMEDVPNDQGRWMHICWSASSLDAPASPNPILKYSVWRMVDPNVCPEKPSSNILWMKKTDVDKLNSEGWDFIHDVTVVPEFDRYYYVAPTLGDSTADGIIYSTFMVIAHTGNPAIYFKSNPGQGYSIDNQAPSVPLGFSAILAGSGTNVQLNWNKNFEEDFDYYTIYRNDDLLTEVTDTFFVDTEIIESTYSYKISAVDFNGNESESTSAIDIIVGVDDENAIPKKFALMQNYPNPFNPATIIAFDIPKETAVTIKLYDILGSELQTLVNSTKNPGHYEINFNAAGLSSGVYFYRIKAGDFFKTMKMMLQK